MPTALEIENASLRSRIQSAEYHLSRLTREQSMDERDEIARAYARADSVARLYGTTASQAVPGESAVSYRKRLLSHFQKHSDTFGSARLDSIDAATLKPIEEKILQEAAAKAKNPNAHAPGTLIPVTTFEDGRHVTRFHGDIMAWMAPFMTAGAVGTLNRNPDEGT
jgi:hypothetical protein